MGHVREKLGQWVKSYKNLVYDLEDTLEIWPECWRQLNLGRVRSDKVTVLSCERAIMIILCPLSVVNFLHCMCSRGHICSPIFVKLGQKVYLNPFPK